MNPDPVIQINLFEHLLKKKIPFVFIRFSDGETEILKNRPLIISSEKILFRGKSYKNIYPKHDYKNFDPIKNQKLRLDLIQSAKHKSKNYFKGIPTSHNDAKDDRDFMLELNKGLDEYITFADLLMNSNYYFFRTKIINQFKNFKNISLIANHNSKPNNFLSNANFIKVPDNFFSNYQKTFKEITKELEKIPEDSLILCSASSLSNIIGYHISKLNSKRFIFIDIGSSMNDYLGLKTNVRTYHLLENAKGLKMFIFKIIYKLSKNYTIRW